jgi:hypothetical protein
MENNPDHWKEWLHHREVVPSRNIDKAVTDYLRDGDEFRVSEGTRLMQFLFLPSFEPYVSYEIFREYSGPAGQRTAQYTLVKTSWDFPADFARWKVNRPDELLPTLSIVQAVVDKKFAVKVNNGFRTNIRAWFEMDAAIIGNDGAVCEVAFGDYFLGVRFRWWEAPTEWKILHELFFENVAKFEQVLKQET